MRPADTSLHVYGVQGVASSNPAAPTNGIKYLGQSFDWPFYFLIQNFSSTPTKVPPFGLAAWPDPLPKPCPMRWSFTDWQFHMSFSEVWLLEDFGRVRYAVGKCKAQGGAMAKQCVKCGYVRQPTDTAPDYECPKCGVIYAKVSAPLGETPIKRATKVGLKQCPNCAEDVKAAATLCPHCKQPIFSTNPQINSISHLLSLAVLFFAFYAFFKWWIFQ